MDKIINKLTLHDINKWYPTPKKSNAKHALVDINMELTEGIYGLTGKNGAGKSTLLKILMGYLKADSGNILWNGNIISTRSRKYKELLGYMPQQQALYDTMSCVQYLNYIATLKDIKRGDIKKQVDYVLEKVNLADEKRAKISSLSGGMKQRLLFAQSILGNPLIILLDEPTAGVDPDERINLQKIISDNCQGKIVIMSTHILSDIEKIAKAEIILENGYCKMIREL